METKTAYLIESMSVVKRAKFRDIKQGQLQSDQARTRSVPIKFWRASRAANTVGTGRVSQMDSMHTSPMPLIDLVPRSCARELSTELHRSDSTPSRSYEPLYPVEFFFAPRRGTLVPSAPCTRVIAQTHCDGIVSPMLQRAVGAI
jgi:hypothetical protein